MKITSESFTNGKATIKNGRKTLAKVFDRAIFYPLHNIKGTYSYQFSVVDLMGGSFECANLDEVNEILNKYLLL